MLLPASSGTGTDDAAAPAEFERCRGLIFFILGVVVDDSSVSSVVVVVESSEEAAPAPVGVFLSTTAAALGGVP